MRNKPTRLTLEVDALKEARIPKRFWEMEFKTFNGLPSSRAAILSYAENFKTAEREGLGLFLHGPANSCKTFLATFLMKLLLVAGYSVRYHTLDNLHSETLNNTVPNLLPISDQLVIIDDVNRPSANGQSGQWQVGLLRKIIRFRIDNLAPFVLCSQLNKDEFLASYGPDIVERLSPDCATIECAKGEGTATNQERARRKKERILGYA